MILPKQRDPRFITVRRGGTLQDADHQLLALWAADCAQHVLPLFEAHARDWAAAGKTHSGIILTQHNSPYEIVRRLIRLLNQVTADEMQNHVRYI